MNSYVWTATFWLNGGEVGSFKTSAFLGDQSEEASCRVE